MSKRTDSVAYRTSRSGAMIMTSDELFTMLETLMRADHVQSKGDAVIFIGGYMTGEPKFFDRLCAMIEEVEQV